MNNNNYTPSSELQRAAEEQIRNIERRVAWARRVFKTEKRWPSLTPSGVWRRILELRDRRATQHAGNSTVVKMPRRRRQYMHARLPEPPEAA
jgi:hypothetical protein